MERRVLFEGMLDVDFDIIPKRKAQQLLQDDVPLQLAAEFENVFSRAMRVLLDKDGMVAQFRACISSVEKPSPRPPTQPEFLEVINDFFYHAVWTTKKLRRGELWTAKACSDGYMKWLLLQMMEWHSRATKGWNYDTWFHGRFLEEWTGRRALERLRKVFFAHYGSNDGSNDDNNDVKNRNRNHFKTSLTFWSCSLKKEFQILDFTSCALRTAKPPPIG